MSFLQVSSALLHPYLQCVHSAAPLAMVRGLLIARAARRYFAVWLAERLVIGLFGIAFPLPPLPLYILVVGGCYSLACLQSSRLILFQFFFHSFISTVFIIIIIIIAIIILFYSILIGFHRMSFSVTGAHVCVFYFVYPFVEAGARGWVVDTAGHRVVPSCSGCLVNCRVVLGT